MLLGRVWTTTQAADGSATTERSDSATASFVEFNYNDLLNLPPEFAPAGSCLVTLMPAAVPAARGLEAGRVSVAGPPGMFDMTRNGPGFYTHAFEPPAGPLPAGAYRFAGPGGEHIGPFEAAGSLPDPIELLNPEDLLSIDREAGLQLRWTGGSTAGTSFVQISGSSPFSIGPDGPVGVQLRLLGGCGSRARSTCRRGAAAACPPAWICPARPPARSPSARRSTRESSTPRAWTWASSSSRTYSPLTLASSSCQTPGRLR